MTTSTLTTVQHRPQQPPPTAKDLAPTSQERPQTPSEPPTRTHQPVAAQPTAQNLSSSASVSIGLKKALAGKQDLMELGKKLNAIMTKLGVHPPRGAITTELKNTLMDIHPDSPYTPESGSTVTLETYIKDNKWFLPTRSSHINTLADAVLGRALQHPLGNFGGSLSWPLPLTASEQRTLLSGATNFGASRPNPPKMGMSLGILEYLNSNQKLSEQAIQNPAKALEIIISTPRAQALGQSLQTQMGGIATDSSVNDYALAAINLMLDPDAVHTPQRNKVAGFDLAQQSHWGEPVSKIHAELSSHLSRTGKTTPEMAKVGAYLLLARKAPLLLAKDIPDSVTYGSAAWVSFAVAAASVEANAPGTVPNLSYAQIMTEAQTLGAQDKASTQQAKKAALLDWAVVQGVLPSKKTEDYSAQEVELARTTFNAQSSERIKGSRLANTEIPSRKEIALAKLTERFGAGVPFEEPLLVPKNPSPPSPYLFSVAARGPVYGHSLLDIAMGGQVMSNIDWKTSDPRIAAAIKGKSLAFDTNEVFNTKFSQAMDASKESIAILIKHFISELPLSDRKNFEFGALEFRQEKKYARGLSDTYVGKKPSLYVKTTLGSTHCAYEINTCEGKIKPISMGIYTNSSMISGANTLHMEAFTPTTASAADLTSRSPSSTGLPPNSFSSPRTQILANVMVEHLDIDNETVVRQATGSTRYEDTLNAEKNVNEFFLDLVPLRSAIVNFSKGNFGAGTLDLAFDVFGFATAGAGVSAKVLNATSKAASAGAKALQAGKVIGKALLSEFNPFTVAGNVLEGGVKLVSKAINTFSAGSGSYDLLKAASRQYDVAAKGNLQVAGNTVETSAVLKEGKWYSYDVARSRPYGSPLQNFTPTVVAHGGDIQSSGWFSNWFGQTPNPNFERDFDAALLEASHTDSASFNRGFSSKTPPDIAGYTASMSIDAIKKLAVASSCSPEQLGRLSQRIDYLEKLPQAYGTQLTNAKLADAQHFNQGYTSGNPAVIDGYSSSLTITQIKELTLVPGRTPHAIGCLKKQIERKAIAINLENSRKFSEDVTSAGGTVTLMPQGYYLNQVNPISGGECAALSNAMAYAIQEGKQHTLIENFFTVMAHPEHANTQKFRQNLTHFQATLRTEFHGGQTTYKATYSDIISDLASAEKSESILIGNSRHGITAGVVVNGPDKEWFYYDPNFGLASFKTEESMRNGLERAMNSGTTSHLFKPNPGTRTYDVAAFNELYLINTVKSLNVFSLFAAPINIPKMTPPITP